MKRILAALAACTFLCSTITYAAEGAGLEKKDIFEGRVSRYSDQTSVEIKEDAQDVFFNSLKSASPISDTGLGKALQDVSFVEFETFDDVKYTYSFYENGLTVAKAESGKTGGQAQAYSLDSTDYRTMLESLRKQNNTDVHYPLWLSLVRRSRTSSILVREKGGAETRYDKSDDVFSRLITNLRYFYVKPDTVKKASNTANLKGYEVEAELQFENGNTYLIQVSKDGLLLRADDMDYALVYEANENALPIMKQWTDSITDTRPVPNTGKPVIYLYPKKPEDVTVKLDFRGELGYTYPTIQNGGWEVTAYPDGRLTDKRDGKEYYYLFWDGTNHVNWDFSEGFVVKGSETASFLREKLAYMGLNSKEINDFVTYWLPEMHQNPYNLITFSTEQYEALAPLTVTPQPDSVLRVHMVYKALDKPVQIKEQTLERGTRTGFAVVEWGGSRA